MRLLVVARLLVALVAGGLFAFGVLPLGPKEPELPDLFTIVEQNDPAAITAAIEAGALVNGRNEAGLTPRRPATSSGAAPPASERWLRAAATLTARPVSAPTALCLPAARGPPARATTSLNAAPAPPPTATPALIHN